MSAYRTAILLICGLLLGMAGAACQPSPPLPPASTGTPAGALETSGISPSETLLPASTPFPSASPSHTSAPEPTEVITPTPEYLTCPELEQPQLDLELPRQVLYVNGNQLWLWDEGSQDKAQIELPAGAAAPLISTDGQFAAYLLEGQSFDTPENPLSEIPLWMFNRQSGQAEQVISFPITEKRSQNPHSPRIYLRMRWIESDPEQLAEHWLLVEVYVEPWSEGGCCVPGGDLYLVKAETGESRRIMEAGLYTFYSIRPDGRQIAALNMDGLLYLIDVALADQVETLSVQLPANPWLVFPPAYSPDSAYMAFQVENGLIVIDANSTRRQELNLESPCEDCYWGPRLPVIWQADSKGFFTSTSLNDHFNQQAETSLMQVALGSELKAETLTVIRANPYTFNFSPDDRYLSYWNQPDWDEIEADESLMNRVTLNVMDLQNLQNSSYAEQYGLRLNSWSPDNQHFLYTYSSMGGPNLDRKMFSLGNICQPSTMLPVPAGLMIDKTQWLDASRFLAWTLPSDGIPDRYTSDLYWYSLDTQVQPVLIDRVGIDIYDPYGSQRQVVVLEP